eukprot:TRINITY_DN2395_c0_g1_i1.p1 TRINITY_DN2395_c0_g1~~TRINITY_DN2395_c0_g1_i1.p1  ORF type:complete len:324 (+),score=82.00 TRINITY_DN2395_c0_g1_i1:54-1025(+)
MDSAVYKQISESSDEVVRKYEVLEKLGSGSFAVVKAVREKATGQKYALKIVNKKSADADMESLEREMQIMTLIKHPNIVQLKEIYESPAKLFIVMEFAEGGELFDRIVDQGNYTEKDASRVVRQITSAIEYLHAKGIVHRDLKPENLLCSSKDLNSDVKIADFGLSKMVSADAMLKTACGTPGYVAPEIIDERPYGPPVDMWSVGVIAYILLCGFPPFYDDNIQVMYDQVLACQYEFPDPWWSQVSSEAKDFISKLLVLEPEKRLTAAQALQHPWVKGDMVQFGHLQNTIQSMKSFNARRKFKMAILATLAITKTASLLKKLS